MTSAIMANGRAGMLSRKDLMGLVSGESFEFHLQSIDSVLNGSNKLTQTDSLGFAAVLNINTALRNFNKFCHNSFAYFRECSRCQMGMVFRVRSDFADVALQQLQVFCGFKPLQTIEHSGHHASSGAVFITT